MSLDHGDSVIERAVDRFSLEKRYVRPDGGVGVVILTLVPMASGTEFGRQHLVIIEDITRRKAAERIIRELNESLERRFRARTADLERANKEMESFSCSISRWSVTGFR